MKAEILIILFLLNTVVLFSQPSALFIAKNLTDFTDAEIINYIESPSGHIHYTFIIDSNTQLSKINLLKSSKSLSLIIDLPIIPKEFYEIKFDSLTSLNIDFKSQLQDLNGIEKFKSLKSLGLTNFYGLELPSGFSSLSSLTNLYITASNIENIDVLIELNNLKSLDIKTDKLKYFPQFKPNNKISTLILSVDSNFTDYSNISTLQQLEILKIDGGNMTKFPTNFGKEILSLSLYNLPNLDDITGLGYYYQLKDIFISYTGLKEINGDFSKLSELKRFNFSYNDSLKSLKGICSLKSLNGIEISYLPSLIAIDFDMSNCVFKKIELSNLSNLKNINGILSCKTLNSISLNKTSLEKIPENFEKLENLEGINISHNNQLTDISEIKNMKSLKAIRFYECNNLTEIPKTFSSNSSLTSVHLQFMKKLVSLNGIGGLEKLRTLYIRSINLDFSLPNNLQVSKNIEEIIIESVVKDISMIENLNNLKHLSIMYSLSELPESIFSNSNIEIFELYQSSITDLTSLAQFKKLKGLHLAHNLNLQKIPDLTNFKYLNVVVIKNNKRLKIPDSYKNGWDISNNRN